jgi:hypothetical protein
LETIRGLPGSSPSTKRLKRRVFRRRRAFGNCPFDP